MVNRPLAQPAFSADGSKAFGGSGFDLLVIASLVQQHG
jgi:hypothetical protein